MSTRCRPRSLRFVGQLMQTPPAHSALKFEGRAYYEYARRGIDIPRAPRPITIHALRLVHWQAPDAILEVECSKGTYVRALAADIGDALGCGAHLAALRRTASGGFDIADAVTLDALESMDATMRDACLRPPGILVRHLPALRVAGESARRFCHGGAVPAPELDDGWAAAYEAGALLGIADVAAGIAHPRRMLAREPDAGVQSGALTELEATTPAALDALLRAPDCLLSALCRVDLDAGDASLIRMGRPIAAPAPIHARYRAYAPGGLLLGVLRYSNGFLLPERLLRTDQ